MLNILLAVVQTQTTDPEPLPSYEGAFLKMALTFVAVIVGIIGTVWFMRKLSGGRFGSGSGQSIKIIERKSLSPKTMLYIIEVDGKQAVITESQLEIKRVIDLETTQQ